MLVVRVELHSAVTGKVTEIARMHIINDATGTRTRGDYLVRTLFGRSKKQLDRATVTRTAMVENWPRLSKHVWYLVAAALRSLDYTYKSVDK